MEGYRFSCVVSNGEGSVESEPIQLKVKSSLDQFVNIVVSKNTMLPVQMVNVLSKAQTVSVETTEFNLALLRKDKIGFKSESTCYTLQ